MTTSTTSEPSTPVGPARLLPDIAFTGKAGSGKTTAADWLVEQLGYRRVSFASVLKNVGAQIWGEGARTDRDKLQRLGVAVREIDPDAWVRAALRQINTIKEPVVVDDLRFENELDALVEEGFVVVRVTAPRNLRLTRLRANGKLQDESQLEHVSETALDGVGVDYTITNHETKPGFAVVLSHVLYKEKRKRA